MATIQSGHGEIVLFEDFCGAEFPVALTDHYLNLGQFAVTGLNIDGGSAGLPILDALGANGVGRFTTGGTEQDSVLIRTGLSFVVGKNGTIVMECRIKSETITLQQNWFGLADATGADDTIEDHIIDTNSSSTVIDELTCTDMCGFLRTSEATAVAEWHAIWKGGSAAEVASLTVGELDVNMVAGEWQILRLEVDNNGTARWFIDGVLLKTLVGAVSTDDELGVILGVDTHTGSAAEMDCDYILVRANRDWTV